MGSNIHLKTRAINLRKQGKSYNEICRILGIQSKGTLSHWFEKIELSEKSIENLKENNRLAHERGLFTANKNRSQKIKAENAAAFKKGSESISKISEKELILIGAALYWGEGSKSEKRTSLQLDFTNSDPLMIAAYLKFVRKILKVPEEKIRSGIHLYPSTDVLAARNFWSKTTKLPIDRFFIVTQVSAASHTKRPINTLPFGTLTIRINSRTYFNIMKGMIHGIATKLTK